MPEPRFLRGPSSDELAEAAASIAGFRLTRPEYGSAANVSGLRTKTQTFSSRRDSLTVFASDNRYGYGRRAGAWTGDGRTAVAACRRAPRAAKVPAKEIARIDVVSEMGQLAERPSRGKVRVYEPTSCGRSPARAGPSQGIPVWSAYAMVGLNAKGEIGTVEVHWPELPSAVLKEAGVLHAVVAQGFKPPRLRGREARIRRSRHRPFTGSRVLHGHRRSRAGGLSEHRSRPRPQGDALPGPTRSSPSSGPATSCLPRARLPTGRRPRHRERRGSGAPGPGRRGSPARPRSRRLGGMTTLESVPAGEVAIHETAMRSAELWRERDLAGYASAHMRGLAAGSATDWGLGGGGRESKRAPISLGGRHPRRGDAAAGRPPRSHAPCHRHARRRATGLRRSSRL